MRKNLLKSLLILLTLVLFSGSAIAQTRTDNVLNGVYNLSKNFLNSNSALYFNSSAAFVPQNNYNNSYPGYNNNQYYNGNNYNTNPLSQILNSINPNSNSGYYPQAGYNNYSNYNNYNNYDYNTNIGYNAPAGEIFVPNAGKKEVLSRLKDVSQNNNWRLKKSNSNKVDNNYFNNLGYRSNSYDAYELSFTKGGNPHMYNRRRVMLVLNQIPGGTLINLHSDSNANRAEINSLTAYLNSYYPLQARLY